MVTLRLSARAPEIYPDNRSHGSEGGDGESRLRPLSDGDVFYSEDEGEHWDKIVAKLPPICKWGHQRNLR